MVSVEIPVHAFKNRVSGFGLSFISMLNGLKHKEIMHMFKGKKNNLQMNILVGLQK